VFVINYIKAASNKDGKFDDDLILSINETLYRDICTKFKAYNYNIEKFEI
jgi:hypothetical protein